ncbi:MAG: NADH-quinone oxidoreductase subunit H [Bdellovibrionaceae bacterium]|nr:NADH-quinone oxidoreductase subunit H [Pseudobdellovibrionaceae bacterium]
MNIAINAIKIIFIFLLMVKIVPLLVWVERRASAFIQNRFGPNRVGPLGLTQLLADLIKFLFKEEFVPKDAKKTLFYLAPILALIPGALAFGAIPLSVPFSIPIFTFFNQQWGPYVIEFQSYSLNFSLVFILGVSALGVYSILLAGWASANKYSLFGALRAAAQVISYELALGVSLAGVLLIYSSFDLQTIVSAQQGVLAVAVGDVLHKVSFLPNWGIFFQPLGFVLFFIAVFAETNRHPFDLPEAEAELVAGYHTEYGGLKMNMFYIAEYGHMLVGSALMTVLFFGGHQIPFVSTAEVSQFLLSMGVGAGWLSFLTALTLFSVFMFKVFVFLWIFIWVRWTLPRFKYDQLMQLGWTKLLPLGVLNTIITAIILFIFK